MQELLLVDPGTTQMDIQDIEGNSIPSDGLSVGGKYHLSVPTLNNSFATPVPAGTYKWSVSLGTLFDIDEGFQSDYFELTRKKFGAGAVQAWLIPKVDIPISYQENTIIPIKCISTGNSKILCNVINIRVDLVSNTNLDDKFAELECSA